MHMFVSWGMLSKSGSVRCFCMAFLVVKEAVADFERELVSEREQAMTRVRIELEAEA